VAADAESGVQTATGGASETISQLLAKILSQLSLSAWLPSAALVLTVAFILQLGSSLAGTASIARSVSPPVAEEGTKPAVQDAISHAVAAFGRASFGGIVLLLIVIVVATMVTQAFVFEAIRFLEGYWGPNQRIDRLAAMWCRRHQKRQAELFERYDELAQAAWTDVEAALVHERPRFTKSMAGKLRERVTGQRLRRSLSSDEQERVDTFDWEAKVQPDVLRQLRNVERRMADYPLDASRVMATRLGNVLRRHEVETGVQDVENFIERVYHSLPFSMQLAHDEQRARLDLYCSMVFVLWLGGVAALFRFGWWEWPYSLTLTLTAMAASLVAYRAAIASGRYYGALLVGIADWVSNHSPCAEAEGA
jgi:hypothetical protein